MSRGKPLSFNRNEVLLKALDLFWEKGFARTSMTELLNHMGIQRQSFYNTFGNKEEVFIEALRYYGKNHIDKITVIMGQDQHPIDNIKELFVLLKEAGKRKKQCGCLVVNSMSEFGDSKDAVGELIKKIVYGSYDIFLNAFTQAIENKYIAPNKNPKVLATAFLAMLHGQTMLRKVGFNEEVLNEILEATEELLRD